MAYTLDQFKTLVRSAVANDVSDIHLRTDERPCFRMRGDLASVKTDVYSAEYIENISRILLKKSEQYGENLKDLSEVDGSFDIEGLCRLRYNIFRYQDKLAIILRIIKAQIPTIADLGLPSTLKKISEMNNGLVLVTGATGSGKSSTLAAMINHINQNFPVHILTLEDPIEFVHKSIKAKITQREIGQDTKDFNAALKVALRQDPDIILIGEMRDPETIAIALKAAETGHLVFGTVHTTNALTTIGRLISMFPPEEQHIVRERIADNLRATVSQRLLKSTDEKGVIAAQEIMISSPGIRDAILKPDGSDEIYTYIRKGKNTSGSQTFDQHLTELYKAGKITIEEAKLAATSPEDFERNLMFSDE
jgi:twitching motility protein PilT